MNEQDSQTIILVVDDYPAFLDMIETTLQAEGYEVWTATNGHLGPLKTVDLQNASI